MYSIAYRLDAFVGFFFYFNVVEILPVSIVLNTMIIMFEPFYHLHYYRIREHSIPFFNTVHTGYDSICFGLVGENSGGYR